MCCWINPYIAQESEIFDEGVEGGYYIKRSDGSVWQYDFWVSTSVLLAFESEDLFFTASWNGFRRFYKPGCVQVVPAKAAGLDQSRCRFIQSVFFPAIGCKILADKCRPILASVSQQAMLFISMVPILQKCTTSTHICTIK